MIKLWPSTPGGADSQLTPRVGKDGRERVNPFDISLSTAASPLHAAHHHALLHAGEPLSPTGPLTPRSPSTTAFAQPTEQVSINPPEFHINQPPAARVHHPAPPTTSLAAAAMATKPSTSSALAATTPAVPFPAAQAQPQPQAPTGPRAPFGQIHVKLLSARGLNVHSARACPYVVAEFENSEFVSRDPVGERGQTLKGAPTPAPPRERKDSHAAHALGAISFRAKQAAEAAAAKVAAKTAAAGSSPSSAGSSKSGRGSPTGSTGSGSTSATSLFGSSAAHSPTWKHEVVLCVSCHRRSEWMILTCLTAM
jgi:hypothetical protein